MNLAKTIAALAFLSCSASAETSHITVQISSPLSQIETQVNKKIPAVLHNRAPRREVCVPAERGCTKIPYFKGIKIYSRMECIDITPRITCDISENVKRVGQLNLSGKGSVLTLAQTIQASATARGRGAIGKNMRQTVSGTAAVTANVTASIAPNWTPQATLDLSHRWTRRPALKLFNVIKITVGSEADKAIAQAKKDLKKDLPGLLQGIGLRQEMVGVWRDLHKPVPLEITDSAGPLYLHLRPEMVGFSQLDFSGGVAKAAVKIKTRALVSDTATRPWKGVSALPNLSAITPSSKGIDIRLPVRIKGPKLSESLAGQLPFERKIGSIGVDKVLFRTADLTFKDGRMFLDTKFDVIRSDGKAEPAQAVISAAVGFSKATQDVKLKDIRLESGLTFKWRALIKTLAFTGALKDSFDVPLASALAQTETQVLRALRKPISEGVTARATARLVISDMAVKGEHLQVEAHIRGSLALNLGF